MKRTLILIIALLIASGAYAVDHWTIKDIEFLGWSKDGRVIAYKETHGYTTLDQGSWKLQYVVVKDLGNSKILNIYKFSKSGDEKDMDVEYLDVYKQAKSSSAWERERVRLNLIRGNSNPESPSRAWHLIIKTSGNNININTTTKDDNYSTYPGDKTFRYETSLPGIVLMTDDGIWARVIGIEGAKKFILFSEQVISSSNGWMRGNLNGQVATFWEPNEKYAVIVKTDEGIISPIPSSELIIVKIPSLGPLIEPPK